MIVDSLMDYVDRCMLIGVRPEINGLYISIDRGKVIVDGISEEFTNFVAQDMQDGVYTFPDIVDAIDCQKKEYRHNFIDAMLNNKIHTLDLYNIRDVNMHILPGEELVRLYSKLIANNLTELWNIEGASFVEELVIDNIVKLDNLSFFYPNVKRIYSKNMEYTISSSYLSNHVEEISFEKLHSIYNICLGVPWLNNARDIKRAYLPSLTVGKLDFYDKRRLEYVNLNSLKSCGGFYFSGCTKLSEVHLDSVEYIGECVFKDCVSLKEISLPNLVTLSNGGEFLRCENLEKVYMPKLQNLDMTAFSGCKKLKQIVVPKECTIKYGLKYRHVIDKI